MKKEFFQTIEIPEGVEANLEEGTLIVKGPEGENKRSFNTKGFEFEIKDKKIRLGGKKITKKEKKIINTSLAHIKNMLEGVQKKFEYQLKICFSHFPISVEIKEGEALIKNFLGEKIPRKVKILRGVEVSTEDSIIKISSINREDAGQTAANFESSTKIRKKDRRIFQDGIFITSKAGKEI
jgi:large subunit ribosomal protein L6